jgi:hypothetical protein
MLLSLLLLKDLPQQVLYFFYLFDFAVKILQ